LRPSEVDAHQGTGSWIDVRWGAELNRRFDCRIKLLIHNQKASCPRGSRNRRIRRQYHLGRHGRRQRRRDDAAALHHPSGRSRPSGHV
jgi:hypothetical protein